MLTRGEGPLGLDMDNGKTPCLTILVEPLPPPRDYEAGIRAITVSTLRDADGTGAAGAKVTSYLASILALAEAKRRGAAEAILLDARGRVVEGTTSNVFAVKGGIVRTPPDEVGLLAGITRALVMEAAPIELAMLTAQDLYAADEVFVTSSIREVVGVVAVDGRKSAPAPSARSRGAPTRRTDLMRRARNDTRNNGAPCNMSPRGAPQITSATFRRAR